MTIRVANAPCSWGVLEFEGMGEAYGWQTVLSEMAACGYEGTELGDWGFMPTEAPALRQAVASRGLALLGAFVPVALADAGTHQAGEALAVKTARLVAAVAPAAFIVLSDDNGKDSVRTKLAGRITEAHALPEERLQTFARGAERIARRVREETGLRTVFHHHAAGFIETPAEVERLMGATDPAVLGLCLDTGHYTFGGGDPAQALAAWGDRIWHVHFKDCEPRVLHRARAESLDYFQSVRAGVFCELGRGSVDFRAIAGMLRARGYAGWIVVEQDVLRGMGTPAESARRNRDFLREVGL